MQSYDIVLLAALQIPTVALAGAGIYLAMRVRSIGSVLVAVALSLSFLKSVAQNFIPKNTQHVFDEEGQLAGAMIEGGQLEMWLDYSGFALAFLLAMGLVLVARDCRLSQGAVVSPNTSLERTREG